MTSERCHTQEVQVIANGLYIPTAEWQVVKVNLCTEADEKGSKAKECHLRLLEVQLPAQLLHLLPGSLLQLLQLLLQGFYTLPLPPQGCSMLADEGLAVCLTISQGAFCLPQFCSQPLLSFLSQAMTNCRPAAARVLQLNLQAKEIRQQHRELSEGNPRQYCSANQNPHGSSATHQEGLHNVTHNRINCLREGQDNCSTARSEMVRVARDEHTSAARRALKAASLCW